MRRTARAQRDKISAWSRAVVAMKSDQNNMMSLPTSPSTTTLHGTPRPIGHQIGSGRVALPAAAAAGSAHARKSGSVTWPTTPFWTGTDHTRQSSVHASIAATVRYDNMSTCCHAPSLLLVWQLGGAGRRVQQSVFACAQLHC